MEKYSIFKLAVRKNNEQIKYKQGSLCVLVSWKGSTKNYK